MPRIAAHTLTALTLLLTSLGCAASTAPNTPQPEARSVPTTVAALRNFSKHKGDYLPAHNFKLEIDGVIAGGFEGAYDADYKDGDDPITHKRPGKTKYKNIVLKRGFVLDPALSDWYKKGLAGKTERKSGNIVYLDRESGEVVRLNLFECWPTRFKARDVGSNVQIVQELAFALEKAEFNVEFTANLRAELKTRHDTVKNSIGNIR